MTIKILDELIVVDYIFRIGKLKCYPNWEESGFKNYRYDVKLYFLNQKELTFSLSTNSLNEAKIINEKARLEAEKIFGPDDYKLGYSEMSKIRMQRDKKESELLFEYHKKLKEILLTYFDNLISFINDSINEFHNSNKSLTKGFDFPNDYNYKKHE